MKLGVRYGSVQVGGLTADEAEAAISKHLGAYLKEPVVSVSLADTTAKQQIAGQHLVGPDGTVTMGTYGSVSVVGMTIAQARAAIEQHLGQYLENPEISLNVYAYNSKVYYIVTQGAGMGDGVYRFPITGNETVLDAISQINGLQQVSSKRIWIARPTDEPGKVQVLPVRWEDITAQAAAGTNYQILPGDRLFVAEDNLIAFNTGLAKLVAPLNQIMGFSVFGVGTVTRLLRPGVKGRRKPAKRVLARLIRLTSSQHLLPCFSGSTSKRLPSLGSAACCCRAPVVAIVRACSPPGFPARVRTAQRRIITSSAVPVTVITRRAGTPGRNVARAVRPRRPRSRARRPKASTKAA